MVRMTRCAWWLLTASAFVVWAACGGVGTEGSIGPAGGQLCAPQSQVCLSVPLGALTEQETFRITGGAHTPAGSLSDGFEIRSRSGREVTFLQPVTVTFSFDIVDTQAVENETLLRVFGERDGDWAPLDKPVVDRVRRLVQGQTTTLSIFAVWRADRLSDGGVAAGLDAGSHDAGAVLPAPLDGGRPDAGRPDAGQRDAGTFDAGTADAGLADAGVPDSGVVDAGVDGGIGDAGAPDAGLDAGAAVDSGIDAGDADAGGVFDAGVDAGILDVDAGVEADAGSESDGGASDSG